MKPEYEGKNEKKMASGEKSWAIWNRNIATAEKVGQFGTET